MLPTVSGQKNPGQKPPDKNEHELVADVDSQTLTKLVKFFKRGKEPDPDTIHNEVLRRFQDKNPPNINPLDKNPPCQKPPGQ